MFYVPVNTNLPGSVAPKLSMYSVTAMSFLALHTDTDKVFHVFLNSVLSEARKVRRKIASLPYLHTK